MPDAAHPTHLMHNGHGFLIRLRERQVFHTDETSLLQIIETSGQCDSCDSAALMQLDLQFPFSHNEMDAPEWYPHDAPIGLEVAGDEGALPADYDFNDDDYHEYEEEPDGDEPDDDEETQPSVDAVDRQSSLLFHMEEVPVHAMLFWSHFDGLMLEVAHHFGIQREELLDCHELNVKPIDIPDGTTPLIVQQIYDIPVGDRAVLILLDIEIHGQAGEPFFATAPRLERKVIAVPIQWDVLPYS
eukprot:s2688_g4.t1